MAATSARQLRCLVIHDSSLVETNLDVLGTSDLALCRLRSPDGEQYVLRSWTDLCEVLLGELTVDSPDLLFCDANFEDDLNGPRLPAGTYDPRGLGYGAVMSAYFGGSGERRPFGFSPYSQNMNRAAEDASAVAFYGILKSMAHDSAGLQSPAVLRAELADIPAGQKPDAVIPVALQMFRTSLHDLAISAHWVQPDFESIEIAATAIRDAFDRKTSPPEQLAISWGSFEGYRETVSLKSLFADFRHRTAWKVEKLPDVATYLDGLLDSKPIMLGWLAKSVSHAGTIIGATTTPSRTPSGTPSWSHGRQGQWERVLTYSFLWALQACQQNAVVSGANPDPEAIFAWIETVLGGDGASGHTYMARALEAVFGKNTRPTANSFLTLLAGSKQWPYPSVPGLKWLITEFLNQKYDMGRGLRYCEQKYWPASLK